MTYNEYEPINHPQQVQPTNNSYDTQESQYMYMPPYTNNNLTQNNWQGITSLALVAISLPLTLVFGIFIFPFLICGIVFGHLGLSSTKKGTANNRSLTLGGLIANYAVLIMGFFGFFALIVFFFLIG